MATKENEPVIGYSGFETFEECYGYDEDACFIAGSEAAADRFMQGLLMMPDYRIVPVTLSQIMDDYGASLGEFAMEKGAFERFRAAATEAGIDFEAKPNSYDPELFVVTVEGVRWRHDD